MLVEHWVRNAPRPSKVELYLLDISHVLLKTVYTPAIETLHDVPVRIIHGNFHDLPRYAMLTQARGQHQLYPLIA